MEGDEKDRIDGVSGGFGKLAAPRREKKTTYTRENGKWKVALRPNVSA